MQGDKNEPCGLNPNLGSQTPHVIFSSASGKSLFLSYHKLSVYSVLLEMSIYACRNLK